MRWWQQRQVKFIKLQHANRKRWGQATFMLLVFLPCLTGQCTVLVGQREASTVLLEPGDPSLKGHVAGIPCCPGLLLILLAPHSPSIPLTDPFPLRLPFAKATSSLKSFPRSFHRSGMNCFLGKTGQCNTLGETLPTHPRNPINFPARNEEMLQKFPWQSYPVV